MFTTLLTHSCMFFKVACVELEANPDDGRAEPLNFPFEPLPPVNWQLTGRSRHHGSYKEHARMCQQCGKHKNGALKQNIIPTLICHRFLVDI